jgi:hypothetical protein
LREQTFADFSANLASGRALQENLYLSSTRQQSIAWQGQHAARKPKETAMTQRRTRRASANPLTVWTKLALKTGEMMLASAQVISHRTGRMAAAGAIPSARDQEEFTLMGQEKIEAAAESTQAMAARMISMSQQMGMLALQQWMAGASSIMALATSRTVAQSGKRQTEFMRDAMENSAAAASHLSDSIGRLAHHGLKPIHSRAMGNAKRLRKVKN